MLIRGVSISASSSRYGFSARSSSRLRRSAKTRMPIASPYEAMTGTASLMCSAAEPSITMPCRVSKPWMDMSGEITNEPPPRRTMAAWKEARVRRLGERNSSESTLPSSARGSGFSSSRPARVMSSAISSRSSSARSLNVFMVSFRSGRLGIRNLEISERLRQTLDVAGIDHVGRQQPQHGGIAAGPREYVTLEQRVAHLRRGHRAAQAEQQPLALDASHRPGHAGRADLRFAFAHVVHQPLAGDRVHHGLDGGGGDRPAAEGGAQVAGAQFRRQRLGGEQRSAGEAAAEGFGGRDDVRRDARVLDGEWQAGAARAALHL